MLLERIYLKTGEDNDKKPLERQMVWESEQRAQVSPLVSIDTSRPAYKQTAIVLAGVDTCEGKVLNPQELIQTQVLNSSFKSYKHKRLQFVYSDWANNRLSS